MFADLIRREARVKTDPSFNLTPSRTAAEKKERFDRQVKTAISVHKTQVCPTESPGNIDPGKHCPIHDKDHPLRKCRGFREKTLEDRKQFLKDNHICFQCCSSTTHLARDCVTEVDCKECGSNRHTSTLHPGLAPWKSKSSPPASEIGEGGEQADNQEVNSKCTEVCGDGMSLRACSKICLVSVFPEGRREESRRMYAILDEQSNRSLASVGVLQHLQRGV